MADYAAWGDDMLDLDRDDEEHVVMSRNCLTCTHNTYKDLPNCSWVSCGHDITRAKTPRPEKGDPSWVNTMTCDIHVSDMEKLGLMDDCAAWEKRDA